MHIIFQDVGVAIQKSQMDLTQLEIYAFSMLKYTDYKLYTCRLVGQLFTKITTMSDYCLTQVTLKQYQFGVKSERYCDNEIPEKDHSTVSITF